MFFTIYWLAIGNSYCKRQLYRGVPGRALSAQQYRGRSSRPHIHRRLGRISLISGRTYSIGHVVRLGCFDGSREHRADPRPRTCPGHVSKVFLYGLYFSMIPLQYIDGCLAYGLGLRLVVQSAQQPFEDLKLSAFAYLATLAQLPWGLKELVEFPGLFAWLFDRGAESGKAREQKFLVVQRVSQCSAAKEILGTVNYDRVLQHLREGPFFVPRSTAVAYESA